MEQTTAHIGWLARHERGVIAAALITVAALAWAYLVAGAGMDMGAADTMAMPGMDHAAWSASTFLVVFVMWAVMMAAMMLPSAAPMILLYAAVSRRLAAPPARAATGAFALGYLTLWTAFSLGAAALQLLLQQLALLSHEMHATSAALGGTILAAAGVYQLTPLKQACLRQCRSPLELITSYWRSGTAGAFQMGLAHGLYCVGCCWMLMALLFVGGVMNLVWIAVIALAVMAEKLAPAGHWLARAAGVALIAWGGVVLWRALA
ncbi:MAG: DUF2182 domain-containing protein [Luteitalea sp.]|nr:DUF2182 domain-containing protein [Luteitalea sp.]